MFDPRAIGNLAIGTAPLGGLYADVDEEQSMATLRAAVEHGVTHFDTAPHYGRGLAERRLGAFLARLDDADRLTVSTKVGRRVRPLRHRTDDDIFLGAPPGESVFDFTARGVAEELDESRERLGRDHIDVALIHDPDDHLDEALVAAEELQRQRTAGRVGAIGVGTNSAEVAHHLLDRIDLDVVLLAGRITLLENSGESVARRCAEEGRALLAAGVLQSGILAGGDTYDYLPAPAGVRARVEELARICTDHGTTLQRVAVNHPRRIPGVTTTLVGVRSPGEVVETVEAMALEPSEELWTAIDAVRIGTREHDTGAHG